MDIKQILALLRHWAWLLVLGLVLGAGGALLGSWFQTPIYQATTEVVVMRAPEQRSSDVTYLSDQQLTQTYIQLAGTRQVIDSVTARLGTAISGDQIRVQQVTNTQIINIFVEDPDPGRAAKIANMLVTVLIETNENLQSGRFTAAEESLQTQITQIQTQIKDLQTQIDQVSAQGVQEQLAQVQTETTNLQNQISALQTEINSLDPTTNQELLVQKHAQLDQLQSILALYQQVYSNLVVIGKPSSSTSTDGVTQLQKTMDLYQQIYLQLLSNLENVRLAKLQSTPTVVQIDTAAIPETPIRPVPLRNSLLGGAVGLMLAGGIVFLIEYLDDTLKTPEEVENRLGIPVLGFIAEIPRQETRLPGVYIARQPRSPVAEAFRSLRTNLEFAEVDHPLRTLMVTSAGPGEGKSTIATNLAAMIAQGGRKVTLLDADLRKPSLHRFFQIQNRMGLTDLFRDRLEVRVVSHNSEEVKGLKVITSGALPPNPAELLATSRMEKILASIVETTDIVVIDTPPALVADAQVLSARVDCVILIIQPGKTHVDAAVATMEQFRRTGARVVGAVLNRITRHRGGYYGNYRYHSSYYYQSKPVGNAVKPVEPQPVKTAVAGGVSRAVPNPRSMSSTDVPETPGLEKPVPADAWPNRPLQAGDKKTNDDNNQ